MRQANKDRLAHLPNPQIGSQLKRLRCAAEEARVWEEARHLRIAEFATLYEIRDLIARAKERGLAISLDPSWVAALIYGRGLLRACEGVDLVLPNLEEANAITGNAFVQAASRQLSAAFPTAALRGSARGARMISRGRGVPADVESYRLNTAGAGDTFNAGFIHVWLSVSMTKFA